MAYESKVIIAAFAEIVRSNETRADIYKALMRIANVEGVILEPFENDDDKKESENSDA